MKFKNTLMTVIALFMGIMVLVQIIFCCTFIFQKKTLKAQIKAEMESEYGLTRVPEDSSLAAIEETTVTGIPALTLTLPEDVRVLLGDENEVNLLIQLSGYVALHYPSATEAAYIDDSWQASEALKVLCVTLNDDRQTALQVVYDNATGLFTIRTVAEAEAERAAKEESEALEKAQSEALEKARSEAETEKETSKETTK